MADSTIFSLTDTVDQIIATERTSLDQRIAQNKLKSEEVTDLSSVKSKFSTLTSRFTTLQRSATFLTKTSTVSDSTVVSATPAVGASNLLFDITVTALAEAARGQSSDVLFGSGREGVKTKITGAEVNTTDGQALDANANVVSGNPNFGAGGNLTAGNFVINNATILVTDSDTVNTILTKINNSSANVTASYNSTTDKIVIEHNEIGDTNTITFGEDSTNFFSKLKLIDDAGITNTAGEDSDLYKKLTDTAIGGSISYGYFTVNNRTFIVDPSADSLNDVMTRVNNSSAGVSMFYDEVSDKITITSNVEGQNISLENQNSNFLRATKLMAALDTTKSYNGTAATVVINGTTFNPEGNTLTISGTKLKFLNTGDSTVKVEPDKDKFVSAVSSMVTSYNEAFDAVKSVQDKGSKSANFLFKMQMSLRVLMQGEITNTGTFKYLSDVGISFAKGTSAGKMEFDEAKFRANLDTESDSVEKLFSFDSNSDGLYTDGGIAKTAKEYITNFSKGTTGLIDQRKNAIDRVKNTNDIRISKEEDYFLLRKDKLLQAMIQTQSMLTKLEQEYSRASTVRVDFSLLNGSLIRR